MNNLFTQPFVDQSVQIELCTCSKKCTCVHNTLFGRLESRDCQVHGDPAEHCIIHMSLKSSIEM